LLRQHEITAVADVRSQPYSRYNPQFNREPLDETLMHAGIKYVYLGLELGARSDDPSCYENGRALYSRIAQTTQFQKGIQRLLNGATHFRVAMMCAEKEPLSCHRGVLISRYLHERGVAVRHILEDGTLENHADSVKRLMSMLKMQETHLFKSFDELTELAYEMQAERIQFSAAEAPESA
jgi:uncharacterized protein (DUF488 family)